MDKENVDRILVLGHVYRWGGEGDEIDEALENLDYSIYQELWLLGDICSATTKNPNTLSYLDEIFNLSNPNTKWAVGNHDVKYGDLDLITEATNRELYFPDIRNNYASFILNTQIYLEIFQDSCDYMELQHQEFSSFIDQVSQDSLIKTVFILSHNPVWSDAEPELREYELIGNAAAGWIDFLCKWNSEFRNLYFDKLTALQDSGKQVICVAGDGGQYAKTFFEVGGSGIKYFVSGINNSVVRYSTQATINKFNTDPDSVLLFNYNRLEQSFSGEFIPLSNL